MTVKACGCHSYLDIFVYADLVGKPWSEGARGPEAYDCLGLAIEIQRRRGFTVPDFLSSEAELHRQLAGGGFLAGCKKLEAAEYGCVVLFRTGIHEHHLGTMIARHRMIHTTAQTRGAVIEPILGPLWERRILGFYAMGMPDREPMHDPWSPA
jgi:cell wall-associated NlpC family hydrolase